MSQLVSQWNALALQTKAFAAAAILFLLLLIVILSRMASAPNYSLLYAGLDDIFAGDVVAALQQKNVAHKIDGRAIYVDAAQRDSLRMELAAQGLPENSTKGYELLDSLSGFGTTSQMFDAAYWRAKEGELARTLLASDNVKQARVHIARQTSSGFGRKEKPSASIFITTMSGIVTKEQANAFRFLVASAISGLDPIDVNVIDGRGNLVSQADSDTGVDSQNQMSEDMRAKVMRLIEARVGSGNAVVEVSVETVKENETIRERRFDPSERVVISSATEETSNSARNSGANGVTIASNLPDGDAASNQDSSEQGSVSRETLNYEVSETSREINRGPGDIKKITVAVLVNGTAITSDTGQTVFKPLPESELNTLRELVSSAIGIDMARGDIVTVRSMQLQPALKLGTPASANGFSMSALNPMTLAKIGLIGLVSIILGIFVVRPIFAPSNVPPIVEIPAISSDPDAVGADATEQAASETLIEGTAIETEMTAQRLRALIAERQDEAIEVLRGWLETSETQS